ncbi:MAG: carbohydrate-binding protein [Eubacteriales bacterium]|nr:carbohydrate-binding protein [Eubacteriales bacterium]
MVSISVKDLNNEIKASGQGGNFLNFAWEGTYQEGDQILLHVDDVDTFYVIRIDDTMDEALVYVTKQDIVYTVPFEEKKTSYNQKSFTGERHYLTIRKAEEYEVYAYRNLAKNVMDQHGEPGVYPHASANVETRGEAVFAARNAIDGVLANESHGNWPYESWGINRQDDAEITLEFGKPVDVDRIVLYTRADFPHDNWWVKGTLRFSDGTTEVVEMEKSYAPHVFEIAKKNITWVKLGELIKADDPSPFPALTQIEVYGNVVK